MRGSISVNVFFGAFFWSSSSTVAKAVRISSSVFAAPYRRRASQNQSKMPVSKSISVPTTSNVSVLKSRSLTASPRATSRSGYDDTRSVTHQNMPLPQPVSFHRMKGTSENASRAKFRELRLDELRRIHLPKLSEKGCEQRSEGGFGRYIGAETGRIVPLRCPGRPRLTHLRDFSDSFGREILGSSHPGSRIDRPPRAVRMASVATHVTPVDYTYCGRA